MRAGVHIVGLIAALMLLAAGCGTDSAGGGRESSGSGTGQETGSGQRSSAPAAVEELRFTATTVSGEEFSGQSLAGKPTVLWFWAAWCPVCEREAPAVAKVARQHGDEVTVVGVAARSDTDAMKRFVRDNQLSTVTHIADTDSSVWQRFGITAQPAYAFIDADGNVDTVKGSLEADELNQRVRQLAGT